MHNLLIDLQGIIFQGFIFKAIAKQKMGMENRGCHRRRVLLSFFIPSLVPLCRDASCHSKKRANGVRIGQGWKRNRGRQRWKEESSRVASRTTAWYNTVSEPLWSLAEINVASLFGGYCNCRGKNKKTGRYGRAKNCEVNRGLNSTALVILRLPLNFASEIFWWNSNFRWIFVIIINFKVFKINSNFRKEK